MTDGHTHRAPKEWEKGTDIPFAGLFGDTAQLRVLQEAVADPYSDYRPKDLIALTGLSGPSVAKAISALVAQGILRNISSDRRRPIYRAETASKKLTALTFLTYAIIDDRDGLESMDSAVSHYAGGTAEDANAVRVSPRDMFIEFLAAPTGKAGKSRAAAGARIYMSHKAAQKFAEAMSKAMRGPVR